MPAIPNKTPGPAQFDLAKPGGACARCNNAIAAGEKFMAALMETPAGFVRADCCKTCWDNFERQDVLAFWQTTMPQPQAPRKNLFVDDEVLCELFARLGEVTEPAKVNFRFVLGLILMRKRLLSYEGTTREEDREVWTVRLRGRDEALPLVNPHLSQEDLVQVSQQLTEILSQEL